MILTCPECAMRYLVPDTAVPPEGRQVRCANCRHSWHQDGLAASAGTAAEPVRPPPVVLADVPPVARSPRTRAASNRPVPAPDVMAHRPPFTARRNPLTVASWVAGAVAALLVLAIAALLLIGRDPLVAALGLPAGGASPLVFEDYASDHQRRSELSNILILSGTIRNVSGDEQTVPSILAEGKDANGRVIYSWTFPPPERTLGAGESVRFDNAHAGATDKVKSVDLSFNGAG